MNSPYDYLGTDSLGNFGDSGPRQPHWRDRAACVDHPRPEIFYLNPREDHSEAKDLCRTCPVAQNCLDDALTRRERDGVWGGTSAAERKLMAHSPSSTGTAALSVS